MYKQVKAFLTTPVNDRRKLLLILVIAICYIFIPSHKPGDWGLNTTGFWADIPHTYANPAYVYPPWGLILMLPYRWIHPEGARFFSVLVIGWLVVRRRWSLVQFFAIALSPYFMVTMAASNMDIFVFVLPILLWEKAAGTRWQGLGWGLALSILLLKPQGAVFIWAYLFWSARKQWRQLLLPLAIVALVVIPISLIGEPPLLLQWINNLLHPSVDNQRWWAVNNVSMTFRFTLPGALAILAATALLLLALARRKWLTWTSDHTISALLFTSMFLSPYASQQSVSSALAFVPTWCAVAAQVVIMLVRTYEANWFFPVLPIWILLFAVVSFMMTSLPNRKSLSQPGTSLQP